MLACSRGWIIARYRFESLSITKEQSPAASKSNMSGRFMMMQNARLVQDNLSKSAAEATFYRTYSLRDTV